MSQNTPAWLRDSLSRIGPGNPHFDRAYRSNPGALRSNPFDAPPLPHFNPATQSSNLPKTVGRAKGSPRLQTSIPSLPEREVAQPRSFEEIVGSVPGGGGGGGGGAGAFSGPLAQAQRRAAQALASLQGQYEARKQELRESYQLAETPEERASIQHVLAMIEAQRDAGTQVIERVYGQAIEAAGAQAEATRAMGAEAGQRTAETFAEAGDRATENLLSLGDRFGGALGAGGERLSPVVEGLVADLARQGASEAAFDERMFGITADDISVLGEAMRPEMGAQVGGLQRLAAQTSGAAQARHSEAVNRRIAQERMNLQQAEQALMSMFDQRRFGLEDQMMAIDLERARLAQQAASAAAAAGGRLSPAQEWALRQEEQRLAREQQAADDRYRVELLQRIGVSPDEARAGVGFGVGDEMVLDRWGDALMQQLLGP